MSIKFATELTVMTKKHPGERMPSGCLSLRNYAHICL